MNMIIKDELVVLRGKNDIFDYIEEQLGEDVRKAISEPIKQAEKNMAIAEYERDVAWDGIRNLEEACLKATKDVRKILFYLENAKRINRDTLANMLEEVQDDINPNYIEY